ncbi:aminotransferase class I/II-fold pyridoxal phosphate-dependent enzyme [Streptomyces sp. NPDC057837]|uniref:aminotransferase class I/II-fold pyridoxal phosphate-dependent enzyme n=1 Tax=unclassified Streptomyces TaxID=2593676 RepID=UPI00369C876B
MGLLAKCAEFSMPNVARSYGLYPFFPAWHGCWDNEAEAGGRRHLMFGSNNYLGLAQDPRVSEAAAAAARKYGTSLTGSRLLNGTMHLHEELEGELAEFFGMPAALVFTTGYQANVGTLNALCGPDDVVAVDQHAHASLFDGVKLSGARMCPFGHNSPERLDSVLSSVRPRPGGHQLVVVDGVYSMHGDICRLPELLDVARQHGADVLVDDAHGAGVLAGGRGTRAHFPDSGPVDIVTLTFSKAFGSIGGAVLASTDVIDYLRHHASSMVYSASLTPADTAAALTSLRILQEEPWRPDKAIANADQLAAGLRSLGIACDQHATPIITVPRSDDFDTAVSWRALMNAGLYTNPVLPPAAPFRLRLSCTATHTPRHLEQAVDAFARLKDQTPGFQDPRRVPGTAEPGAMSGTVR